MLDLTVSFHHGVSNISNKSEIKPLTNFLSKAFFTQPIWERVILEINYFMKKLLFITFSMILLTFGCSDDDLNFPVIAACNVNNPIEDLEWLKSEVQRRKNDTSADAIYCYIEQAINDGETIFIYNDCNPLINKIIPILDCSGTSAGLLGDENNKVENITGRTVIFRPSDFACEPN